MKQARKTFSVVWVVSLVVVAVLVCTAALYAWQHHSGQDKAETNTIGSFEACKAAGNPITESYPEQCRAAGKTFTNPAQSAQNNSNEEICPRSQSYSMSQSYDCSAE